MNLNNKEDVERAYQSFANKLNGVLQKISKCDAEILSDIKRQYNTVLINSINKSKQELSEILQNAIWDKLVIAFVGVTNAGKSTIIETFRILFDEEDRKKALKDCPEGVDGEIIGDGHPDFTKYYKEYNMTINGKPFVLIDVPGIEGNEALVKNEILKALKRCHCVFYVQGEDIKPDENTVKKIKDYLKDWVEVYSILNPHTTAFDYEDESDRKIFKTSKLVGVESQITALFKNALGSNYTKNMTVQANLALCSKAFFSKNRKKLKAEQEDLISAFGSRDKVYAFSNFQEIVNAIDYLSSNFAVKISEAQKKKLKKLCDTTIREINNIKNNH